MSSDTKQESEVESYNRPNTGSVDDSDAGSVTGSVDDSDAGSDAGSVTGSDAGSVTGSVDDSDAGSDAGSVTGSDAGSRVDPDIEKVNEPAKTENVPLKMSKPSVGELNDAVSGINQVDGVMNMLLLVWGLTSKKYLKAIRTILRSSEYDKVRKAIEKFFHIMNGFSDNEYHFAKFLHNCIYFMLVGKVDQIKEFMTFYMNSIHDGFRATYFEFMIVKGLAFIHLIMYEVYTQYISRIVRNNDMRDFALLYYSEMHDERDYFQVSIAYPNPVKYQSTTYVPTYDDWRSSDNE